MKKKISISVIFIVVALMVFSSFAPAFAKKFKVPEGVIVTYASVGTGVKETPVGLLRINAFDIADSTYGPGDYLQIEMWWQLTPDAGIFMPLAVIGTNTNYMDFMKNLWTGVPAGPNNWEVSEEILQVDRHGNSITASLTVDLSCLVIIPSPHYLVIPAFTMELDKVGGSFHFEGAMTLDFYPMASGYTLTQDRMGFNADGTLTCPGWNYDAAPMTDCKVIMHAIDTCIPPMPVP